MKTKILTIVFAIIFTGTMVFDKNSSKAQKEPNANTTIEMQKDSIYYTCSMHPSVKLDKPGKCPECGMNLVKKTIKTDTTENKSDMLTTYTCSMHPEVTSDKPGKCPKCGKDLVAKKQRI